MSPTYAPGERRPETYYGSPDDVQLLSDGAGLVPNPPPEIQPGDELCDGHQMHYVWNGERWS